MLCDILFKGALVRWVYPEPMPVTMAAQSISKRAPHPSAARLFQKWCAPRKAGRGS